VVRHVHSVAMSGIVFFDEPCARKRNVTTDAEEVARWMKDGASARGGRYLIVPSLDRLKV
jgi:hypothetical protein